LKVGDDQEDQNRHKAQHREPLAEKHIRITKSRSDAKKPTLCTTAPTPCSAADAPSHGGTMNENDFVNLCDPHATRNAIGDPTTAFVKLAR
jgi:hypothetical protein